MEYPDLQTEFLFEVKVDLHPPEVIGPGPLGTRAVYMVKGGTFEGPRVRGEVLSGGDWFLMLANGGVSWTFAARFAPTTARSS